MALPGLAAATSWDPEGTGKDAWGLEEVQVLALALSPSAWGRASGSHSIRKPGWPCLDSRGWGCRGPYQEPGLGHLDPAPQAELQGKWPSGVGVLSLEPHPHPMHLGAGARCS